MSSGWAKWTQGARIFWMIGIPFLVGAFGYFAQRELAAGATKTESMKLAVSILQTPTNNGQGRPLGRWAVELLERSSGIPLNEQERRGLISGAIDIPPSPPMYPPVDGYCEVQPERPRTGEAVTFTGYGQGGTQMYVYSWAGDDGLVSHDKTATQVYQSAGTKRATVRITSNGQSVYRTCEVTVAGNP